MFQKWNSGIYLNQGWMVGWLVYSLVTTNYKNHTHSGKMRQK